MTPWRLVCDVGGSNARFAASTATGDLRGVRVAPSSALQNFTAELLADIARRPDAEALVGVAIAAAGPIDDDTVTLTNVSKCTISAKEIGSALGGKPVRLLNDLEAAAWCLPFVPSTAFEPLIRPADALTGPRLIVNIGTGFGAAILVPTQSGWHAIGCEPGHMKLARPHIGAGVHMPSIEDVLSGRALSAAGLRLQEASTETVASRAAIEDLSALIGQVCGDLVLACGAWGGVSLCGSVARAWSKIADRDAFRTAFIDKGPMRDRMHRVQVDHLLAPEPALIGLSAIPF